MNANDRNANSSFVVAVVGVDGCGKSTTWRGVLDRLAQHLPVVGIGERVLAGGPGEPVHERGDVPLSRSAALVGRVAKGMRRPRPYRQLKLVELVERSRMRDDLVARGEARVVVTDGDPLVNSAAWSAASFYRRDLAGDDERLLEVLRYLSGEARIPLRDLPAYLRRAPQLPLMNRLHLARFAIPDLVVLLGIDGAGAMARIRARGRPLQAHESEAVLDRLGAAYERVCRLLETERGLAVVRIPVADTSLDEAVGIVVDAVLRSVADASGLPAVSDGAEAGVDAVDIVATTISGSLRDQRKVGSIGPTFRSRTHRPVRVHVAHSHAEARERTHGVVAGGGRTVVSAGGAGTFNAVLEGSHLDDGVPPDLRLAFLRKGSADLIGKALHVPDDLDGAVDAIVGGIEEGAVMPADILAVAAAGPDGRPGLRHIVGFGGLGIFGDVPRFTEARWVKLYKGILSTLFGDYGPFFVGLSLATLWWHGQRLLGHVPPMALALDGVQLPPVTWSAVIVANGDLGRDFPLGRDLDFASGTFRVVALRYLGLRHGLAQLQACRTAAVLDDPARYGAIVREVRQLVARPVGSPGAVGRTMMVNVDGLRMLARGEVCFTVSGRVGLIPGRQRHSDRRTMRIAVHPS